MSRKWWNVIAVVVLFSMLLMTAGCAAPAAPAPAQPAPAEATKAPEAAAQPAVDPNWAAQPMKDKCTVVLSRSVGRPEKTFQKFAPDLLKEMNIDLHVVAHPFSEQYQIQYLDLSSGAGQYDILSYWPMYTADSTSGWFR